MSARTRNGLLLVLGLLLAGGVTALVRGRSGNTSDRPAASSAVPSAAPSAVPSAVPSEANADELLVIERDLRGAKLLPRIRELSPLFERWGRNDEARRLGRTADDPALESRADALQRSLTEHEVESLYGVWMRHPTALSLPALPGTLARLATDSPRSIPLLDLACSTDADCILTSQEIADSPPRTYACCPGCQNHAGNKTWKMLFDATCKATPAPMCPPIGCAMPIQSVSCVARKCTIK